ncbi:uroporphyrinogen-III synthase [Nitrosomonas sp. Nm51]|uniref:uroporphyrinogen-III synthase n=1 Tax=Nitrosomonas sp. Nm51 TaxID=133720 RepID=UPI0008CA0172|nr:uroporphyrinogen-III synthase [Nitrosomonas sp. Nm51]SEQ86487.1 uroporphyrinogen-III synthase [Nitrosomonas sp. Nm51]
MNQAHCPLQGINVLVTRPERQCVFLAESIRKLGGNPVIFPVLKISDIKNKKPLLALIQRLDTFDLAIFVSPNAVDKAMPLIQSHHESLDPLLAHMKIAAVGKGTAHTLKKHGVNEVISPENRFDSEALLEQNALQHVTGKRVVIFRGNGGRPLLGDTLIQRGALLEYAECYQRSKPDINPGALISDWSQGRINAVVITSSEGLQNLFDIIGFHGQQLLKITPVFTAHGRIAANARKAGLETVVQTADSGDQGLLQGMQDYFYRNKNNQLFL